VAIRDFVGRGIGTPGDIEFFVTGGFSSADNTNTVTDGETNPNTEKHPSNYLICDRSGFRARFSEGLVEEWSGAMVLAQYAERRHPQDFVRGQSDRQESSWRPEQADAFLSTNQVKATDL